MDPAALIIVSTLSIPINNVGVVNSSFHGCSKMWKGISMRSKPGANATTRLNMMNCTVMDAQFAISPESGAILNLSNNNFDKNWAGLNLISFNGGAFSLGLTNNTFQGAGALLPAYNLQSPAPGTMVR